GGARGRARDVRTPAGRRQAPAARHGVVHVPETGLGGPAGVGGRRHAGRAGAEHGAGPEEVPARVRDLRGGGTGPRALRFPGGARVIVTGLPGSGKTTLMRRVAGRARRIDSQEVRGRFERRLPSWLPYAAYRPAVRTVHYAR